MFGPTSRVRCDPHVRRHFGYVRILWRVEHFWLVTCIKNWEVCSPEFEVQTTRWRMILKPLSKDLADRHLSVNLERLCSDPDTVRANWKVRMFNCKGSRRCRLFREMEHLFQKNRCYGEVIESMDCLLGDFEPFEFDDLLIECYLIVSRPDADPEGWCGDEALMSLSDDMYALVRSGCSSDVVIRVGGNDILAVRAVLHARNPTLAHIIDRDRKAKVIDLLADQCPADTGFSSSALNVDAIERMVSYLHCGKLEEVVSRPSVSAAECAQLLDVAEVAKHYVPDELTFTSGVDVEENVVTWFVAEFEERDDHCITSPPLILGSENRPTWKLKLYPRGKDGTGDHVSIYAETFGDGVEVAACLELAVADSEQNFHCFRRLQKPPGGKVSFLGVEDFFERSRLRYIPFQGTLRVVFRLRMSAGVPTLSGVQHSVTSVTASPSGRHLALLSEDLEDLLWNDPGFGDFTIRCSGGNSFRVHRAVLGARALPMPGDAEELDLAHVNADVLRVLLSYVYSGVPKGFQPHMAPDLFQVASCFGVDALCRHLRAKYNIANISV